MAKFIEDETPDSGIFRILEKIIIQVKMPQKIIDRTLTIHQPALIISPGNDIRLLIILTHRAHKALNDILQSNDARKETEFVTDQSPAHLLVLHLLEDSIDIHIFVEINRLPDHFRQIEGRLAHIHNEILETQNTYHMVQIAVSDRIFLIKILLNGLPDLSLIHLKLQPHNIAAVSHDSADLQVAHCKHILHNILLHRQHLTLISPLLDQRLDLLLRHLGFLILQAQKP